MNRAFGRRFRDLTGRFFPFVHFPYLLLEDRKSARFFPRWISSFRSGGRKAVGDGIPWLPFELIEWLDGYLKHDMSVFEYGSGGSTVFVAMRVKKLFTVEHDRSWYQLVEKELRSRGCTNVEYSLREPEPCGSTPPAQYWDNYGKEYRNMSFESYVNTIDAHPDQSLDLVLVDGRARKFCIEHAISKLRPDGYLVLDNSSTKEYLDFLQPLDKYDRIDIASISPFWPPAKWQSSCWRIADPRPVLDGQIRVA